MPASLQVPICHVPCGSGNGIAASLGLWNDATAIHAIVKGHIRAVDAATVRRASESRPLLAVLSFQYGLLADLDIGTEHLRKVLGGERFTYGAVREILKWKKHRARVAYCTTAAHTVGTSEGTGECALKFPRSAVLVMHVSTADLRVHLCVLSVIAGFITSREAGCFASRLRSSLL